MKQLHLSRDIEEEPVATFLLYVALASISRVLFQRPGFTVASDSPVAYYFCCREYNPRLVPKFVYLGPLLPLVRFSMLVSSCVCRAPETSGPLDVAAIVMSRRFSRQLEVRRMFLFDRHSTMCLHLF